MPSPQSSGNKTGSGSAAESDVGSAGESVSSADAHTIQKIQAGDRAAFKSIYIGNVIPLTRYVMGLLSGRDGAEDIVQDVFASIWERRASWNPQGAIIAYLYRAVRNRTLNVLEHDGIVLRVIEENNYGSAGGSDGKSAGEYGSDSAIHNPVMQGGSIPHSPSQFLEQAEIEKYVIDAINTLHERRRVAILLRIVHDLEYDEIARTMEISDRAARILVSRAREELRGILGGRLR